SIQIISFSVLLVNFNEPNSRLQYLGVLFTLFGCICLLWNLILFHLRAIKIRKNEGDGPFEIVASPWVVVGVMMASVLLAGWVGWN
ncbi:hypothetical protein HDU76_011169, partial [Blyttiomyces sp. JEL0837]